MVNVPISAVKLEADLQKGKMRAYMQKKKSIFLILSELWRGFFVAMTWQKIEKLPQTRVSALKSYASSLPRIVLLFCNALRSHESLEKEVFLHTDWPACELSRLVKA